MIPPRAARRSCLAVPASSDRMLAKARTLGTDMVFLDLEDAVAAPVKATARLSAAQALVDGGWDGRIRSVRINAVSTPWALDDLRTIVERAGEHLDTVMLPKCSAPSHVQWADHTLSMLEAGLGLPVGGIGLELQIEDAAALTAVDAIATASSRTQALHFGPGDFQASLGIPTLSLGRLGAGGQDPLHHALGRLLVAGRAAGLQVLDGPFLGIHDVDGLSAAADRAAAMGFDGKWVLHPAQVDTVNAAFTPAQAEFDRAEDVLDAYARATSVEGGARGALMHGDEMIDEASRAMALVISARGRAAGLVRGGAQSTP